VWINDPENGQGNLKSALNVAIWKAFQANGIKIPSPQREVRLWTAGPDAPGNAPPPTAPEPKSGI
jgi:small-conductance mechanosensitive channel